MFYQVLYKNYKWSVRFSWFSYLSLPFVMYFNGRNKDIYLFIIYYLLLFIIYFRIRFFVAVARPINELKTTSILEVLVVWGI